MEKLFQKTITVLSSNLNFKTMRKIILIIVLLFCGTISAQNETFTKKLVYRDSTTSSDVTKARIEVTYFDGLGRPKQVVQNKMSTSGKDLITHIEYDSVSRQAREYLPYPSTASDLSYDGTASSNVLTYYSSSSTTNPNLFPQETTSNPYSEKLFENTMLNRILKQGAPGSTWQVDGSSDSDHTIKIAYMANDDNVVRKLKAVATWNSSTKIYDITFVTSGYYAKNLLYKTVTKNENWTSGLTNTIEEYKDKEGNIVLKKVFNGKTSLETYYVYDQYGNLTYVLPPACNGTNTYIDNLGYQYKYDGYNRIAEKKIPGKQWEFTVYDPMGRAILTGPAINPFGGSAATATEVGWLMNIYDAFGRVAITGWYTAAFSSTNRQSTQSTLGASVITAVRGSGTIDGVSVGYNNITNLPAGFKLLTVNYYDDYTWPNAPSVPTQIESQNIRTKAKGLLTGSWIRVLNSPSPAAAQLSYILYDRRGRAVRSYTGNYLGGYTQVDTKLDFDAKRTYTITKHKRLSSDTEISVRENFTYDAQDRLKSQTHSINAATAQPLKNNTYNELGQLIKKGVGSYTPFASFPQAMQSIDYKYNIRGWLTNINDINSLGSDLFAFKIAYNTVTDNANGELGSLPALYNGNISETYWRSSNDNTIRKYSYEYDGLNRLLNAYYQKPGTSVPYTGSYDEYAQYDKNGNITRMIRNGAVDDPTTQITIDNLVYTYPANSNQFTKIEDGSGSIQGFKDTGVIGGIEYTYDANGNMLRDYNKGITTDIKYNHLNLPTEINIGSNKIVYIYDAAGRKLKKTVTENGNTVYIDYLDGFQYKGGVLQFFPTAEGYVDNTVNSSGVNVYNYIYQYKDHLGNVRVSFTAQAGKNGAQVVAIKEQSHYYPFGLKHQNYNVDYLEYQEIEGEIELYPPISPTGKLANNYKYNSKEFQDELGLNFYDYGARNYDPILGRWINIDPLAENNYSLTPFNYCVNNPNIYIDPDGRDNDYFYDSATGETTEVLTIDNFDRVFVDGGPPTIHDKSESVGKKYNITKTVNAFKNEKSDNIPYIKYNDKTIGIFMMQVKKDRDARNSRPKYGVEAKGFFTSLTSEFSNFQWFQTVYSNDPTEPDRYPRVDSPIVDGIDYWPYYPGANADAQWDLGYYDVPNRTDRHVNTVIKWDANLSLVGTKKDGSIVILSTYWYGYQMQSSPNGGEPTYDVTKDGFTNNPVNYHLQAADDLVLKK